MDIMFNVCVCVHVYTCIPPHTHTTNHSPTCQTQGAQITKNAINPEQIKIIQFCLKICKLWRLPQLWVSVQVGGWMGGLMGWVMSNH